MEQITKWVLGEHMAFKGWVAAAGAVASFFLGEVSHVLKVLALLVILDYVTGFLASAMEGKLSSNIGLRSIPRKVSIVAIVSLGHLIDQSLSTDHLFRDACAFFYLSNEVLSIVENVGRTGLPIPSIIERGIRVLREKSEEGEK